jgi:hypothetical protein
MTEQENNNDQVYSYHTFMFPFVYETNHKTSVGQIVDQLKSEGWVHKCFEINDVRDYSKLVYFYQYVQDALYTTNDTQTNPISRYFEYKTQSGIYEIKTKNGEYELKIDGISLRIFNTDVGILSFNLRNECYTHPNDILVINDYGRRIYPQFLGKEFTTTTKQSILPYSISFRMDNEAEIYDDFSHYDCIENLKNDNNKLPEYLSYLLRGFNSPQSMIDDRMFVLSIYMNDALSVKMKFFSDLNQKYEYEHNDWWYQYVFVDGNGKTCQSRHMSNSLIEKASYDRWVEYGTLFGISRYSFVALTGGKYGRETLLPHMQTMYFQMFTLLLSYRASVIKFSKDVASATENTDETENLYKKYLNFMNKLFFREITAQEQGIELYNKAMDSMQIEKNIKDLDSEIAELFHYTDMKKQSMINDHMAKLSGLGVPLMMAGLIAGIFGMNTIDFADKPSLILGGDWILQSNGTWGATSILWIVGGAVVTFVLMKLYQFFKGNK